MNYNYQFFINECDENGRPQVQECSKCKRMVPAMKIALHTKQCTRGEKNA